MRLITTMLCLLFAITTISLANEAPSGSISDSKESLMKDVECAITVEFTLRNFNLFIAQIQAVDPSGEDRSRMADPLIKMLSGFVTDAEYQKKRLVDAGLTEVEIDAMIDKVKDEMYSMYMTYYANSVMPDQAKTFINDMIAAQSSCMKLFVDKVSPRLTQKENEIDG
jgi:hypothetical protein